MDSEKNNIQRLFEKKKIVETFKTHSDYNLFSRRNAVYRLLKNISFKKVVDLGCGSGAYLAIKKQYNCLYFGLDFSQNMLEVARTKAEELGLTDGVYLQRCNVENTPYPEDSFDLVLAIGLIEYFKKPEELIQEIKNILKKDGILIIQSFTPTLDATFLISILASIKCFIRRERRVKHIKYSKKQLDKLLLKNGFQLVDFEYSNFHLLPPPFLKPFPKIHARFSEYIARKNPKGFSFLAVNYIGKYHMAENCLR